MRRQLRRILRVSSTGAWPSLAEPARVWLRQTKLGPGGQWLLTMGGADRSRHVHVGGQCVRAAYKIKILNEISKY